MNKKPTGGKPCAYCGKFVPEGEEHGTTTYGRDDNKMINPVCRECAYLLFIQEGKNYLARIRNKDIELELKKVRRW